MSQSAVLFFGNAQPTTITTFQDSLANHISAIADKWSFEFKTYKSTVTNLPANDTRLMYSVSISHLAQSVIIKNKSAVMSTTTREVPAELLDNACSTGVPSSLDLLIVSKLSNLWAQRQLIKGEVGNTYIIGELGTVRSINVFAHGAFKGLLIEVQGTEKLHDIVRKIVKEEHKYCRDTLTTAPDEVADLAYQYVKALEI